MKPKQFPSVAHELLHALEGLFPSTLPQDEGVTIADVHRAQGEQRVLRFLRATFEKQNKTILEND